MKDSKVAIITAQFPDVFVEKVNVVLESGDWRVVETEMSVGDSHYYAMLVKSCADNILAVGQGET